MDPSSSGTDKLSWFLDRCRASLVELLKDSGIPESLLEIRDVESGQDADLSVPMFRAAKELRVNPARLADSITQKLDLSRTSFASVQAVNGYLNFKLHPGELAATVCAEFIREPEGYGRGTIGAGRTIVIDYSSPNIAKPFSVGHLRSTIIGQALYNIFSWLGYRVIGDNHLGDWGTQFGKLLCAYERWRDETKLQLNPTAHLLELYVRFHEEAKTDETLQDAARRWFQRLENGDPEARSVWHRLVQLSTTEFNRVYELLGTKFDVVLGESFYQDRLASVTELALARGVARIERSSDSSETVILPLEQAGISTPLILRKSDGTSLYATREIATAQYRIERWHPEKILYVVGNEQQLYFRQFNAALQLLGYNVPCIHVNFGLVRLPEGAMSTREGRIVLLEDVIREAVNRATAVVTDRELSSSEKSEIARKVGIGAIKYADLSQNRIKDVVFDWDRMLSLDGDSAPYLMYAYTRTRSIFRKAGSSTPSSPSPSACRMLVAPPEQALLKHIARFPMTVRASAEAYEPHRIANRLYRLAQDFSAFYDSVPVIKAETDELRAARLQLVEMTGVVLRIGLELLGIQVSERM